MKTQNKYLSFFSLLFLVPIFLSFSSDGLVSLARSGGYEDNIWFMTIPFSIFFTFILIFFYSPLILKKPFFTIFFLYALSIIIANYLLSGLDFQLIKVLSMMLIFISTNYSFQRYFDKKITLENFKNADLFYFYTPVMIILSASLIGYYVFNFPIDSFLVYEIKIYSYSQYFAFLGVLLLGSSSRSNYLFFLTLPLVILISYISRNDTALILVISLAIYFIVDKFFGRSKKNYLRVIFIIFLLFGVVSYFIYMFFLIDYFPKNIESRFDPLYYRSIVLDKYLDQFQLIHLIFPFIENEKVVNTSLHNEYLEILKSSGIFGFIFFYSFIISRITTFNINYRIQSISIIITFFIAGLIVEPALHIYTSICLSYFLALYSSISNTINENS